MNVLVSAASRHGSTAGIARAIADKLVEAGHQAIVLEPDEIDSIGGYDAVILGSAVYAGRWLEPMRRLVDRKSEALLRRPVWLFSSGPIGSPPRPDGASSDLGTIQRLTGARDHRTFAGKVDRHGLGIVERAVVTAVRAPDGDFRAWDSIRDWSSGIARALSAMTLASAPA